MDANFFFLELTKKPRITFCPKAMEVIIGAAYGTMGSRSAGSFRLSVCFRDVAIMRTYELIGTTCAEL